MIRKPSEEDTKALRWAGMMGHRFVVVAGATGRRRVASEQNEDEVDASRNLVDPRLYEQIRYKTRDGRRWRRVR